METFKAYSAYYDLIYRDKSYFEEALYIHKLIKKYAVHGNSLLELGAGTGGHAKHLIEYGYHVTGVELSEEMIRRAPKLDKLTLLQGDLTQIDLKQKFDAVISLFHVVSYQTSNDSLVATFARVREHLKSGGLFIFDFWYTNAVLSLKPEVRVKRIKSPSIEVIRIAEPKMEYEENLVNVDYTILVRDLENGTMEEMTERHVMRHFSIPEMKLVAQSFDFEVLGFESFLTSAPITNETWGPCAILRKR